MLDDRAGCARVDARLIKIGGHDERSAAGGVRIAHLPALRRGAPSCLRAACQDLIIRPVADWLARANQICSPTSRRAVYARHGTFGIRIATDEAPRVGPIAGSRVGYRNRATMHCRYRGRRESSDAATTRRAIADVAARLGSWILDAGCGPGHVAAPAPPARVVGHADEAGRPVAVVARPRRAGRRSPAVERRPDVVAAPRARYVPSG